jgi:hypothetical protein
MTITVTHSTPADGSFSASGATAWNASHTLSGTIDIANGGTGQTTSTAAINALLPTQATNSGKYLTTDGTNTSWATVSGGGSPGGSTTQVQYNSSGAFAGSANLTFNGTTLTAAGLAGPLNGTVGATTPAAGTFTSVGYKGATSGTVTLTAPTVAGSQSYTLPDALPTIDGQALVCTAAGVMSWSSTLPNPPTSVEYLVVAGGGGAASGAGGAGGLLTSTSLSVSSGTSYTVTVGGGGAGAVSGGTAVQGSNSVFSSITATGGGKGGQDTSANAGNGGSGGGAGASNNANSGGTGVSGQGFAGGSVNVPYNSSPYPAGGGGGASAVGVSPTNVLLGGNGGAGTSSSITGTATTYAGGGGGGVFFSGGTPGTGGAGGGGNGGTSGSSGTPNTGGGGGGAAQNSLGGNGASGVVIIAYPLTFLPLSSIGGGLTYTVDTTTRSGYRVYRFTAGTGTISW